MEYLVAALFWLVIGGAVGRAMGKPRGREMEGLLLGACFSVLGWIVVLLMAPAPAATAASEPLPAPRLSLEQLAAVQATSTGSGEAGPQYVIWLGGREAGPFTGDRVAEMLRRGTVKGSTPCKAQGDDVWSSVGEMETVLTG